MSDLATCDIPLLKRGVRGACGQLLKKESKAASFYYDCLPVLYSQCVVVVPAIGSTLAYNEGASKGV